jgi:SnoaL-like polyketide cyclase
MQNIVLEIAEGALPNWRFLPHWVRWHVGSFPGISMSAQAWCTLGFAQSQAESAKFAAPSDVAGVATLLSTAFPRLARRVTSVALGGPIIVRLECEGLHEGMWGNVLCPTRRRVTFEEQHEIVDGRFVSDRITLDLPGILRQLCDDGGVDPDETARMGRARRELHERSRVAFRRFLRQNPRS